MSYVNPLHYAGPPMGSYTTISNRHSIPPSPYAASKWRRATNAPLLHPVAFDTGLPGQGVPMRDLLHGTTRIRGTNDPVYQIMGNASKINFHIMYPGYETLAVNRTIDLSGPPNRAQPLTRAQLGAQIAKLYTFFMEKASYQDSTDPQAHWRIGSRGVKFDKLVLVSLVNFSEGQWYAEIAVDI
ncbi:hypothetical protein C8J56DRAFT_885066 [Mycena floridula]|nr:hypothetical protein C8J56DRAFT_885066 [Mycena floridula]